MCGLNSLRSLVHEQLVAVGNEILVVLDQSQKPRRVEYVVFIKERLAAAADEISVGVERVIRECKEDLHRYRLLDIALNPYISLHRADAKQLLVCKQEWSFSLDQEEPELPHIKVEQEELWTSQEGEQYLDFNEADIKVTSPLFTQSENYRAIPVSQSVSSDQSETKTENRDDLKESWRKGRPSVTAGEDRTLHSSAVSQPNTTSGNKRKRGRSHCCQDCRKSLLSKPHLHQHAHPIEKLYHCQQCGKGFSCLSKLQRHQLVHTGEKPHHCQQCGKRFSQLSSLRKHQRVHTGKKPYNCQQCRKSFSVFSSLQIHQRVHTRDERYNCKQCGKRFSQLSSLQIHLAVHIEEMSYNCQQCAKRFSQSPSLQTHERVHPGETSYNCKQCEKRFSQLSRLLRHQRVHTGEKPHHCKWCGKRFSRLSSLQKHRHVHTREKPYQCQWCAKSFNRLSSLQKHQHVHSGEKPYHCQPEVDKEHNYCLLLA